jgi:uncharacterized membrane protein
MKGLHDAALVLHVACGFAALVAFWVAALARKGGTSHRMAGRTYVVTMMSAVASALIMATLLTASPRTMRDFTGVLAADVAAITARLRGIAGLFFALALLTFTAGWNGIMAVRTHTDPARGGSRISVALAALNAAAAGPMAWAGLRTGEPLLVVCACICLLTGVGGLWTWWRAAPESGGWMAAHARNMIATGIAAHTAFLAVGAVRFFPDMYSSSPALSLIPWLMPSLVGTFAIAWVRRRLRGDAAVPALLLGNARHRVSQVHTLFKRRKR